MNIKDRYALNKTSKVGVECNCPSCGTTFIKSNYQQAFCKTRKGTKCEDKYWNTVDLKSVTILLELVQHHNDEQLTKLFVDMRIMIHTMMNTHLVPML